MWRGLSNSRAYFFAFGTLQGNLDLTFPLLMYIGKLAVYWTGGLDTFLDAKTHLDVYGEDLFFEMSLLPH
jgi:hypothetical protein